MKAYLLLVSICLVAGCMLCGQPADSNHSFNDGPYLFFEDGQLIARWIEGGELKEEAVRNEQPLPVTASVSEAFDVSYLETGGSFRLSSKTSFKGVEKLAAISDIHGQYDLLAELLKAHRVIDEAGNWSFGDGHLVVVGDIFDRGDRVTDILWLIHKLEKQAATAGGMVHFLLGNHEVMVLQRDHRYINKKYRLTTAMLGIPYDVLFGKNTYLGRWLRSKPVAISINDIAFVHAGFSEKVLQLGLSFEEMNAIFQNRILDQREEAILNDSLLRLLYLDEGPVWYRGYFEKDFDKKEARSLLKKLGKKHIVVGHTSFPEMVSLHRSRVIGVDSSIKNGENGEILIYEAGKFFRGSLDGNKVRLK